MRVGFDVGTYTVVENETVVLVTVTLMGRSDQVTEVTLNTQQGSATGKPGVAIIMPHSRLACMGRTRRGKISASTSHPG